MHYSKIELSGYTRFKLNSIKTIRMEPQQTVQLILGTNGVGKSSLLREITPLPSPHTQYEKGGYKLLELTHNGHEYRVLNQFDGKSGKYALWKDNENIFHGSTASDYRTLIRQEFGITPEIQSLIDGVTRFSTMDVARRRYWFTMLIKADFSYALQYYGRLRSRIRDLQGALSIAQNRHANESSKVLSEDEVVLVRQHLDTHRVALTRLIEHKPRHWKTRQEIETILRGTDEQMEHLTRQLEHSRGQLGRLVVSSVSVEPYDLENCRTALHRVQGNIEHAKEQEQRIRERLEQMLRYSKAREKELVEQENQLTDEQRRLETEISVGINIENVEDFRRSFLAIDAPLTELLELLPSLDTHHVGLRDTLVLKERGLLQEYSVIAKHSSDLDRERLDMEYAKKHHHRTCPSCNHRWYQGYEEGRYQHVIELLSASRRKEEDVEKEITRTREELQETVRVIEIRNRVRHLVTATPSLHVLWDHLFSDKERMSPTMARSVVSMYRQTLPLLIRRSALLEELRHVQMALTTIRSRSSENVAEESIESVEHTLVSLQDHIRYQSERQRVLQTVIEHLEAMKSVSDRLESICSEREQYRERLTDVLRIEHVNRLIHLFRQEISMLEYRVSGIDAQKNLLQQLSFQIQEHEEEIRILKMAEQALSPSTGLIAKGLTGFINYFTGKMNHFVKRIWSYPLEILPIVVDEESELEYRFPVELDHGHRAKDVRPGECNGSTCEIFDLAFRIVAMECLGLRQVPLQLDEFGSTFDHHHRNVAFQVVSNLATSTDIPQVFMVSHHEQSYSSLRHCDITLLHGDNVRVPDGVQINGRTWIT